MAALRSDIALLEYPEHIPKARRVLGHRAGLAELAGTLKTVGRRLLERLLDGARDRGRNVAAEVLQARRRLSQVCREYRLGSSAAEGRRTRQHLVAEDAERIDVGAMIDVGVAEGLLGRHVADGAERHSGARDARVGSLAG